jgi:hypothetical protein
LEEITQPNGEARYYYSASIFGDIMRLTAQSLENSLLRDRVDIIERVSGLEEMGPTEFHVLTGQTGEHADNHWINPSAYVSLAGAARAFAEAQWNTSSELMRINDISLPYGGGFDIYGHWQRDVYENCLAYGHCSHRTGKDVDIENLARIERLREVLEKRGWRFLDEGQLGGMSTRYPHFRYDPE